MLLLLAVLLFTACGGSQGGYAARSISGVMPALQFQLTGEDGEALDERAFRGEITLVYFGYTHCPRMCPMTLGKVARALSQLEAQADSVRMLFISVDPARDTPAALAQYTGNFAPQIVGATGTEDQLTALAKRYRVAYRRDQPDAEGNYAVYHSSAIFVFDGTGAARLLMLKTESAAQIAADLSRLIKSSAGSPS